MLHKSRQKFQFLALVFVTILPLLVFLENLNAFQSVPTPKPVPRMKLEGLRKRIYESQWIQLFPNLKKMVQVVTDSDPIAITNAKHTSIKILNSHDLRVGGTLRAIITSYNEAGKRKTYGGDFFAVILRRPGSNTDGVTCEVTDDMNGSYSVTCILPWEGAAILEARLIHPSETVYQLMKRYSSEKEFQIHQKTKMRNSKNETEFTACSVGFPDKRPDEVCDYSNPTHGEKRTCLRPPSGECPKVILHQEKVVEGPVPKTFTHPIFCNKHNFIVHLTGSGLQMNVSKSGRSAAKNYSMDNLSKFIPDPMTPSGWLVDADWTSVKTRHSYKLDRKSIERCTANKRLYFFGDSTARGIFYYFVQTLNLKDYGLDNSRFWSRGRDAVSDQLNVTLQYRSHGPPLNNPGPEDGRPYMSDSFDAIREGGKGTIVMFTIGYHFQYFDTNVYLRRLKIIKTAIIALLHRLPGAKVLVKDLHFHGVQGYARSPWLTYKLITILRHVFRDVKDVYYVEMWDYTLLNNNMDVHVQGNIFTGTIKLLVPYIC